MAWLPSIETLQRDVRRNKPNTCPTVSNVYDAQLAIPQNYTQQFLVSDNRRPDGIILLGRDEGFHFISNSQGCCLDRALQSSTVQIMKTYTIHGIKNHKIIVGVCALVSIKRRAT